jgi:hypothetical protein
LSTHDKELLAANNSLYKITVISSEGTKTILSLWPAIKIENNEQFIDTDKLIGSFESSNDYFIVRYFDIDPVLKKRAYFFAN